MLLLTLLPACFSAGAVQPDSSSITNRLTLDMTGAYVPPTSDFFRGQNRNGENITSAIALNLKYSFSFPKKSRQWRHYPGAYQGIGVGMNSFFAGDLLGNPVSLFLFQGAPAVRFSPRLSLGYEWNFGASFGWKAYRPADGESYNPDSESYTVVGSRVNAYINLAVMLRYRLSPLWQIEGGLTGSHFSNGNTRQPNSGVNTIGLRVGLTYTFGGEPIEGILSVALPDPFKPHFSYDLMVYGAWKRRIVDLDGMPTLLKGSFGVAGVNFAPMYDFNPLFRAGVSLDVQYDESASILDYKVPDFDDYDPKFYRPPFFKSLTAGLSAKAEFVMPVFSVAVGIGHNIAGAKDYRSLYQTLTLKTYITRNLFLNVGYRLHEFKHPSNLMLGVGYSFNR